ncbi:MAG: cysteine--tRNA ligase [Gammaproteobacteria bacterium]|nr:cysteine--tRNA ligase [Gammaproteobacteria bacterium]
MLQIYNSLSKKKEKFTPLNPNNVRMYVCGMTVYDYCHLGHARVLVVFDMVYRHLRKLYGEKSVTYIRNITDIDDKIIKRANENGEDFNALTGRFIDEMNKDSDALGVIRPDQEPRATAYIGQIIEMVQTLIEKGLAYAANNGDVYYDVSKFEGYGKLSGRSLNDMQAGARVEIDEVKDDPMDFVLWKAAKPGEPYWESPWGNGRPGWHIECSAMSTHCLGDSFDIHGGGMDLKFPHHENEIAQSEGATGKCFAHTWMHNGHIMVDQEKMSKSLGNFFTVRDVLKKYSAETVRAFILSSHYRSPLNYSQDNLDQAKGSLDRFYTALRDLPVLAGTESGEYATRFYAALNDDFNTAEAFSVMFDVVKEINRLKGEGKTQAAAEIAGVLRGFGAQLGLLQQDVDGYFRGLASEGGLSDADIEALIVQRNQARADKNWAEADRIRDVFKAEGIILEDAAGKTSWKRS